MKLGAVQSEVGRGAAAVGRGVCKALLLAPLCGITLCLSPVFAQENPGQPRPKRGGEREAFMTRELEMRVACLQTLIRFVEWPEDKRPKPGAPFVLGVTGHPSVVEGVQRKLQGSNVAGNAIQVRYLSTPDQAADCQIVFFCRFSRPNEQVRRKVPGPVLTVGESPGFLAAGGMVNFIPTPGRLRFEVNEHALREAGLVMSSKLLRLARAPVEESEYSAPVRPAVPKERDR